MERDGLRDDDRIIAGERDREISARPPSLDLSTSFTLTFVTDLIGTSAPALGPRAEEGET